MKIIKFKQVNQRHMAIWDKCCPAFSPRTSCESKSKKRDTEFYSSSKLSERSEIKFARIPLERKGKIKDFPDKKVGMFSFLSKLKFPGHPPMVDRDTEIIILAEARENLVGESWQRKIRGAFMNKIILYIILLLICTAPILAQDDMTADEIINTMTETMNPEQSKGKMKMTIVTTSGDERTFEYETYSKNQGEKSLMKYTYPNRVMGQTILMLNDANDIWTYFPKTKRIRKLATHAKKQKLEGSDFSYEDMGASNEFINEYDAVRLKDEKKQGRDCYKLELTRKPEGAAGYSRIIVWVDKEYLVPQVIDYYHDDDPELWEKQLICTDIQLIDGIYTPMKCTMYNKLDATHTSMEITEITYEVDLPDDLFTEMGMQK